MKNKLFASVYLLSFICIGAMDSEAHNSYTGGYSGAPGSNGTCASCHTAFVGTITVSGFPAAYVPGQTYTITVGHNGGSKIINFNATARIGTSTTVAGKFSAGTGTVLYTGTDGGVSVPSASHLFDLTTFQWTAPAMGTGSVNFYLAGMQGTSTSSSSGQSTKFNVTAVETVTGVESVQELPKSPMLLSNFPNPFNPTTTIRFQVPVRSVVSIRIYDVHGKYAATLADGEWMPGTRQVEWDASRFASGIYWCQMRTNNYVETKKLVLLK
jgi:hypothetical protein